MKKKNIEDKIRPDRDINNPNACIDLDDIQGKLKTYPRDVSLEHIILEIKKFDVVSILLGISSVSVDLFNKNLVYDETFLITYSRLSYLTTLVLLYGGMDTDVKMSKSQFEELMMKVNRYHSDIAFNQNAEDKVEELERYSYRQMYIEKVYNRRIQYLGARNEIIFRSLPAEAQNAPPFNISKVFYDITGVAFDSYSEVGMAIAAIFKTGSVITNESLENFKNENIRKIVRGFLKFNSINLADFRKTFKDEPFELSPFLIYPILSLPDGKFICPILKALIYRSFDLYHIFFKNLKTTFSIWYGDIFQQYVGKLLKSFFDSTQVVPEIRYTSSQSDDNRSVDWLVWEGKTLLLFECKTKRLFHKKSIFAGDMIQLQVDIEQSIAEGVLQLDKTLSLIKSKEKGFETFAGAKEYIPIVVVAEFANENSISIKKRVNTALKNKYNVELNYDYHVIDIEELETILAYRNFSKRRLVRNLFKEKLRDEFRYRSFINYICERFKGQFYTNTLLRDIFEVLRDKALKKVFEKT